MIIINFFWFILKVVICFELFKFIVITLMTTLSKGTRFENDVQELVHSIYLASLESEEHNYCGCNPGCECHKL